MITCAEAVRRLWAYLEEEASDIERADVEEHLAFCRRCCGEAAFARELGRLLASAATVETALPPGVEQRLTDVVDALDAPPGHPAVVETATFDERGGRRDA